MKNSNVCPTTERWLLLERCSSETDSSIIFQEKIAHHIMNICPEETDKEKYTIAAEAEAKRIRLMLESGKTEAEILKELKIE